MWLIIMALTQYVTDMPDSDHDVTPSRTSTDIFAASLKEARSLIADM